MKKHLPGFLAALIVAGVISLITARRIEAQYSSPVKIMNTTSAPAITSNIDDPGRVPYQSIVSSNGCAGSNYCYIDFPVVPAGHRLVVTQMSGAQFLTTPYPGPIEFDVNLFVINGVATGIIFGWTPTIQANGANSEFVYPLTAYLDAGSHIQFASSVFGTTFITGLPQQVVLTGYLLDCSAAPCPAIAQ